VAEVTIRHQWNERQLDQLRHARTSGIVRDLMRRGYRVQRESQQILRANNRVDHGRLIGSITVAPLLTANVTIVRVGTDVSYAQFVEEGTGLYGPRHAKIYPKRAKVLVFTPRKKSASGSFIKAKNRTQVFARWVRGSRGVHFLRDGLKAARN
jgi:hypothetical protein